MKHMIKIDFSTIKNSRKRKSVKPRRLIKQKKQPIGKPGARISDKKMKLNEPRENKRRKIEKLPQKPLRSTERNNVMPNDYWLRSRKLFLHFMPIWN